ncbi:MAG: pitrilysin family protein [Kofleriaceae bacterium]
MRPRVLTRSWWPALAASLALGLGAVGLTAAAPAAPAAAAATTSAAADPEIPFERYKLDNGLEVILSHDPSVPLVAIDVWYHVGSGHEVPGKSGFAHLFEHMLFQGSKHVGTDKHFDFLKSAGASEVNGTTNTDRTNYYEVVPSHQLELALWLESDRMAHLLPLLTQASLDNQIDTVRNERAQRYDGVAYGATRFAISHALYPVGHPYRDLTIGRHEDLEAASLADVVGFYKTWYVPANATLAIVGDFDPTTIRATVAKWFGTMPTSVKPTTVTVPPPAAKATRVELTDEFAKLRRLDFVALSPAMMAAGDAELDMLADVLTREGTGRLYRILVHERQLAQSVVAYQWGKQFSGEFTISVTLSGGAGLAAVEPNRARRGRQAARRGAQRARARPRVVAIEGQLDPQPRGLMARAEQLRPTTATWAIPAASARPRPLPQRDRREHPRRRRDHLPRSGPPRGRGHLAQGGL